MNQSFDTGSHRSVYPLYLWRCRVYSAYSAIFAIIAARSSKRAGTFSVFKEVTVIHPRGGYNKILKTKNSPRGVWFLKVQQEIACLIRGAFGYFGLLGSLDGLVGLVVSLVDLLL